jgi:hypothetical protein
MLRGQLPHQHDSPPRAREHALDAATVLTAASQSRGRILYEMRPRRPYRDAPLRRQYVCDDVVPGSSARGVLGTCRVPCQIAGRVPAIRTECR